MTRNEVLEALLPVFRERGVEGATISEIAKATRLGKATLYHHFPAGKDEMLEAIVQRVLQQLDDTVFAPLLGADSPKRRLLTIIRGLAEYAADGERNCLLAMLAMGTARVRIAGLVAPRMERWTAGLERLYGVAGLSEKRAGRAAHDLMIRFQGAIVMSRLLGDSQSFQYTIRRLTRELEKL